MFIEVVIMISEKVKLYNGGRFQITFNDEMEHKDFLVSKYFYLGSFLFGTLLFLTCILLFILALNVNSKLLLWSVTFLFLSVGVFKIFEIVEKKYEKLKYRLILEEIKKNNFKIDYANESTGHITYSIKGVRYPIYVYKGKNAKSAK